jgi:hypothetical protein
MSGKRPRSRRHSRQAWRDLRFAWIDTSAVFELQCPGCITLLDSVEQEA